MTVNCDCVKIIVTVNHAIVIVILGIVTVNLGIVTVNSPWYCDENYCDCEPCCDCEPWYCDREL